MCALHVASVGGSGWTHAVFRRTSVDSPSSDGDRYLSDGWSTSAATAGGAGGGGGQNKRSMSWLLAAVMSVCEEDPRKCRVSGRGRQRLRGGGGDGGEYVVVDADDGALSAPLLNDNDEALKRSLGSRPRRLEIVPIVDDRPTENCRTGNC